MNKTIFAATAFAALSISVAVLAQEPTKAAPENTKAEHCMKDANGKMTCMAMDGKTMDHSQMKGMSDSDMSHEEMDHGEMKHDEAASSSEPK